jgi:D-sedoheptulose 7-phosphate isomerase
MKNTLEELFQKSTSAAHYAQGYAGHLAKVLQTLDFAAVQKLVDLIAEAREQDRTIFFIGNGGSAATCSHFATDLGNLAAEGAKPFRAISLTDNTAFITALSNDDGFENVFANQLRNLFREGDLLVAISGSGNSENIVRAIRYVHEKKGTSYGIVGFDGGLMKSLCHHALHIPTRPQEYGPVEDACLVLDHMVATYLMYQEGLFTKSDRHPCNRLAPVAE